MNAFITLWPEVTGAFVAARNSHTGVQALRVFTCLYLMYMTPVCSLLVQYTVHGLNFLILIRSSELIVSLTFCSSFLLRYVERFIVAHVYFDRLVVCLISLWCKLCLVNKGIEKKNPESNPTTKFPRFIGYSLTNHSPWRAGYR